jgi:hypothetical protein
MSSHGKTKTVNYVMFMNQCTCFNLRAILCYTFFMSLVHERGLPYTGMHACMEILFFAEVANYS